MILKKYIKEFKEFAVKGNAIDLAVGVIIGGAFGKIITSLVADIIMPPVGVLMGGINFADIKVVLKHALIGVNGSISSPAINLNIGLFLQNILDFFIVAFSVFFMVKVINRLKRQLKLAADEAIIKEDIKTFTKDQELLMEIRDLLKNKK